MVRFVLFCGLVIGCWLLPVLPTRAAAAPAFIAGADLSLLQFTEDHGVQYKEGGVAQDALSLFKAHGCNYVRLRLFVDPKGSSGQVNTLAYTVALARRVKAANLPWMLDLHYSDGWADPGHQAIPAQWQGLTHLQLVDQIFAYTRDTLAAFRLAGCPPDMVQVGNEITNGMLWPDGGQLVSEAKWDAFAELLQAGIRGVHAGATAATKIVIHIDKGSRLGVSRSFFAHLTARNVPFDMIGLSYYPFQDGPLAGLRQSLDYLAGTYRKDIIVAETAQYWRGGKQNLVLPYPRTPEGQKAFLADLLRTVAATPGGHGRGVFYWAPEWIEGNKWYGAGGSGDCESRALFDPSGNMLPALNAFREAGAEH